MVSDGKKDFYKTVVDVSHSHRFRNNSSFYEYGIYMGHEYSDAYLDGVRKHHMILVGSTLARLTGYEFKYIEEAIEES